MVIVLDNYIPGKLSSGPRSFTCRYAASSLLKSSIQILDFLIRNIPSTYRRIPTLPLLKTHSSTIKGENLYFFIISLHVSLHNLGACFNPYRPFPSLRPWSHAQISDPGGGLINNSSSIFSCRKSVLTSIWWTNFPFSTAKGSEILIDVK